MTMAKGKAAEQTALAAVPSQTSAVVAPQSPEALALAQALDFDFDSTGLEEADAGDLRFASKIWNLKKKRSDRDEFHRIDEFYDTLTEETTRELNCVLVTLHKTADYSFFDNAANETVRVCTSYDRVTGKLRVQHPVTGAAEGTERPCAGCPDAQWVKSPDGKKNVRNCSDVYGVIGFEFDTDGSIASPFMIRFKKTGLNPFKTHLQKHHLKRRKDPKTGRLVDVPLFAYPVKIKLEADPGGLFAIPVIERGEVLSRDIIQQLAEHCSTLSAMANDVTRLAETKESQHGADAIDTTGTSSPAAHVGQNDFAD
jgi:hypothetical protein